VTTETSNLDVRRPLKEIGVSIFVLFMGPGYLIRVQVGSIFHCSSVSFWTQFAKTEKALTRPKCFFSQKCNLSSNKNICIQCWYLNHMFLFILHSLSETTLCFNLFNKKNILVYLDIWTACFHFIYGTKKSI